MTGVNRGAGTRGITSIATNGGLTSADGTKQIVNSVAVTAFGLRQASATPPAPLLLYINQANFAISGTGAAKADSYTPLLSPQAITVTGTTASGSANLDRTGLNLNISALDDFQINFHIPTGTPATDIRDRVNGVTLFFCSDAAGFTNYLTVQLLSGGLLGQRDIGWNVLGWKKSEMTTVGASFDPTSVKQIRTQIQSSTGGAVVTVDSIWANAKTRAKALIQFDDGWKEAFSLSGGMGAFEYLQSKGMKGSYGIIGGLVGVTDYMTHAQLQQIYDAGHDLNTHGINYAGTVPGYQNLLAFPVEADAITNCKQNRQFLRDMGFPRSADFYIFPQGIYNETILDSLDAAGFKAGRATTKTLAWPHFSAKRYLMKLPSVAMDAQTFAQVKPYIDRAIATGGTVILYGHRLQLAGGAVGLFMTASEFYQVVDYLQANSALIDTVTSSDYIAQVAAALTV